MLSIGKLVAGQARYYLDQAEARVDVVDSIGDGIEEYYVGPTEARGQWIGAACRELGLDGHVEATALRRVLAGLDPRDGSPLRDASRRVRVAGFDLTFSAPKSVSVLFALGDEEMRNSVRAAHDLAASEALGHLERAAAAVRRGRAGAVVEEASGLIAAGFRHRTSRAGDPQLHTHVLVANLGRGLDGRWSALDGRRLYAHARSASFIYQAVLRSELTRTLGVDWTPVRKGIAEVVGIPRPVLRAFSRRRAVTVQSDDERAEFAPIGKDIVDPVERLATQLRRSAAQVLAIDAGGAQSPELDGAAASQRRIDAEREAAEAAHERSVLERRRHHWLPGRGLELDEARTRERAAKLRLAQARRLEAEMAHGRRPFASGNEADRTVERLHDLVNERAAQRMLQPGREVERER